LEGTVGLASNLAQVAGISLVRIASLELVALDDTGRFLDTVHEYRLVVLGIEGFRVNGDQVTPDMGAIADFSRGIVGPDRVEKSIQESRRFIGKVAKPGLFFEFALKEMES
jgi:hypothetical protein